MKLSKDNYFSTEFCTQYWSVSQFKTFKDCEARAIAELDGDYVRPDTKDLLIGSYVDAYFSGEMDEFISSHPDIFNKRTGELKVDYQRADELIRVAETDDMFMDYMDGDKQVIMTGELFGVQWKIKVDALHDDKIVDLKVMKDMQPIFKDGERKTFIDAWGYDIQGFVYQQIVKANTGKTLPFYLAVLTKEKVPDKEIIHIPDYRLNAAGEMVKYYIGKFDPVKRGIEEPTKCGVCDWCRAQKRLTKPLEYEELLERL